MLIFLSLVSLLGHVLTRSHSNYSTEALQKEYPGLGTQWIQMVHEETGEIVTGYFDRHFPDEPTFSSPEPSEVVTFTLYTRKHPQGTTFRDSTNTIEHIFDPTKPSKFITHGWNSGGNAETCIRTKNGFLEKYDANVFIVDWSGIANNRFYFAPMAQTRSVGDYYAEFLNKLVDFGADPLTFHLVGHSLGAHVSGFAARGVEKGPVYRLVLGGRLDKTDATFVDVIHTCSGLLGIDMAIGHADFYPNDGNAPQPGCESVIKILHSCSHERSWEYFIESLVSKIPFMSYRCDHFSDLDDGKCDSEGVPMGDPAPSTARGEYYLRTNKEAPFAIPGIVEDESSDKIYG